ncbi:hypothetical protein ACP70R_040262 [Stipagrostis hirtigluma subsp. patula]
MAPRKSSLFTTILDGARSVNGSNGGDDDGTVENKPRIAAKQQGLMMHD